MTSALPSVATVAVPVSVLWHAPDAIRAVDAPIVADRPDHAAWLAAMDAAGVARQDSRFGLDDRVDSQVVAGEPVLVLEQHGDWSYVVAPWQPSRQDPRGYPGYVRSAHLDLSGRPTGDWPPTRSVVGAAGAARASARAVRADAVLASARTYLGLPYLWGGTSATALDCSGIVHLVCRTHGLTVPRDAHDQHASCATIPLGAERPGDLYFFAYPGKDVHHVGFVTGDRQLLHAPRTGSPVVEEPMSPDRVATLVGAGRIPGVLVGG